MYYILQIISSRYLQTPVPPEIHGPYASFDEAWDTAHKKCQDIVEKYKDPDLVMLQNREQGTASIITKDVRNEFYVADLNAAARLNSYQKLYGDILFSKDKRRLEVYQHPSEYFYSFDGLHWAQCPVDLGKIAYESCIYRKRPENITVGVTTHIQRNRQLYSYSTDNGVTWKRIPEGTAGDWVYHGPHTYTWFRETSPQEVCEAFLDAGWILFPRKNKKTCVFQLIRDKDEELIDQVTVPMSRELSDYDEAMKKALSKLKN